MFKHNFRFLQSIGVLVVLTGQLSAATYYVRTDGSNSNTGTGASTSDAWATVVHAATQSLGLGDIVYVRPGTYVGEIQPSIDGSASSPIQFIADSDGSIFGTSGDVILQATSGVHVLDIQTNDYLEFIGFKLQGDNSSSDTVEVDAEGFVLEKCEIYAGGGSGVDINGGSVTLKNCLLRNNLSDGVSLDAGELTVWNTTIAYNGSDGIEQHAGTSTITNSIVAFNSSDGLDLNSGTMTHTYNCVFGNGSDDYEGTSASTGEFSLDPLFLGSSNFRLPSDSPAIDAGTDAAGTVDDDISGFARPYGPAWDLGCYEGSCLVGHWKLDEESGTTATDSSSLANTGSYVNSPTLAQPGLQQHSVEFNGSDQRVVVPEDTSLKVTTEVTMVAWVKPSPTANAERMIINKEGEYEMALTATGELKWAYKNTDPGWSWHHTGAIISDGVWSHIAVTYLNGTVKTYVNGQLVETYSGSGTIGDQYPAYNELWIAGRSNNPTGASFAGNIDDARVYRCALSNLEVAKLYGLIGHWRLDEVAGTAAVDSSNSGLDGTYVGGPTLGGEGAYPGNVVNSVEFDGVDDKVDLPNANIDFSNGFSVAVWVKPAVTPGVGEFYAFFDLSNGQDVDEIWLGMVGGGVGFQLHLTDTDDGSPLRTIEDNGSFEQGKWVHCVVTVDPAGNAILYRNGEVTKSGFYTSIPTNVLRNQNTIGTSPLNDNFSGSLDDVRLYGYALSAIEISELYGLVGHWKMEEGGGTTAADTSGFANNATLSLATWTTDCNGESALDFDGVGGIAATNSSFDPPERGTVAFWFQSKGSPAARQRLWGVGGDFEMWQDSDGLVSSDISTDGFQGGFITTEPLDKENRWYHLIAQYDSDDDSYSIYINGELHKSGISTWAMTKQPANKLTFGTRTGNSEYFEGAIRDFRIYNRPLSGSEISELSKLIAYWKLNETSGTVAVDSSPNGHDGMLSGNPTWTTAGNIDGALDFETTDGVDHIDVGNFNVTGDQLTIAAWVKPENGVTDGRIIIKSINNTLSTHYWGLAVGASLELDFRLMAGGTTSWFTEVNVLRPGKWNHVAGTYDGTTMRMYVDGREVGSIIHAVGGALDVNDSAPVLIGDSPIGDRAFDGRLDDIQVFSRAMCPDDVFFLYRGGRPTGVRIVKWVEVR